MNLSAHLIVVSAKVFMFVFSSQLRVVMTCYRDVMSINNDIFY